MQRFRQETGKSHRAGPVLMSAKNDLAALQENFSFGKSRYIRNDKAAMPMRSAQRSSTYNAISCRSSRNSFLITASQKACHAPCRNQDFCN